MELAMVTMDWPLFPLVFTAMVPELAIASVPPVRMYGLVLVTLTLNTRPPTLREPDSVTAEVPVADVTPNSAIYAELFNALSVVPFHQFVPVALHVPLPFWAPLVPVSASHV